jgi:FkbM family methyltransferase
MKLDEILKNKFLYSKGLSIFKLLYFCYQFFKSYNIQRKRKLYSNWGLDMIADDFFKKKSIGIYIDVGCHHPFLNNNTYRLYKRGWSGLNIDLDFNTIEMFNFFRRSDLNIEAAVSNTEEEKDFFFFHNRSAINTLSKKSGNYAREIKKINTTSLNTIIENSRFKDQQINYISIDVEGHELNVLKGFDLKKYKPNLVILEFIDPNIKEFYHQKIQNIIDSELYHYMNYHNYKLVNWIHDDLVFTQKENIQSFK